MDDLPPKFRLMAFSKDYRSCDSARDIVEHYAERN
jgi:hypothetical protein